MLKQWLGRLVKSPSNLSPSMPIGTGHPMNDQTDIATTPTDSKKISPKTLETVTNVHPSQSSTAGFNSTLQLLGYAFIIAMMVTGAWLITKSVRAMPPATISINPQSASNTMPLTSEQISQLQQVLGTTADSNIYQVNLQDYKTKAESLSWVNQVDIKRDWQKGLVVTVIPRQAVAKYGSEKLIDSEGHVFTPTDAEQLNQNWLQLQGDKDTSALVMQQSKQVTEWFRPLGLKPQEVILTPRMTWLFRFDNGLRVLVDKETTSEKLYKLSLLLQNQLKSKLAQMESIDLRYKNGMAVTWRHTAQADETNPAIKTTEID